MEDCIKCELMVEVYYAFKHFPTCSLLLSTERINTCYICTVAIADCTHVGSAIGSFEDLVTSQWRTLQEVFW